MGNVIERDGHGTGMYRGTDVGPEHRDVELEDTIGIQLITLLGLARLEARVELESQRQWVRGG
jgi:hypothetical protein